MFGDDDHPVELNYGKSLANSLEKGINYALLFICRDILSIDSRLNQNKPSTNTFPPNPEQGYITKFEILLEEVFSNSRNYQSSVVDLVSQIS